MTCFGISGQFSYPVQEFMLKNDTQKNGTSRIGLHGNAPPPPDVFNGKSKNTGKDVESDGLFEEQNNKGQFLKNLLGSGQISRHC